MLGTATDPKVFERLSKLLALAKDGGATEHEAALAMEKAQALMFDNNLTMAEVEATGKTSEGGARAKHEVKGMAMYDYQQELMEVVGKVNFCYIEKRSKWNGKRHVPCGYRLIGREANVASAVAMFDYLNGTMNRLAKQQYDNANLLSRHAISWKHGISRRLQERLTQRFEQELAEQERRAREAKATQRHPAAATGNALVVVMRDFLQDEEDHNNDFRQGWEPGTTARRRAEWEAAAPEREARWAIAERERDAREAARLAALTPAQRRKEEERAERESAKYWERERARKQRYWNNRDMGAFHEGKRTGDSIGLDQQIDHNEQRKLK